MNHPQPQVIEVRDRSGPPPAVAILLGGLAAGLGLGIAVAVWQVAAGLSLALAAMGIGSGVGLALRGAACYTYHARIGQAELVRAHGEARAQVITAQAQERLSLVAVRGLAVRE